MLDELPEEFIDEMTTELEKIDIAETDDVDKLE